MNFREGKNDSVDYLIKEGRKEAKYYIEKSPTKQITAEESNSVIENLSESVLVFDLMKRNRSSEYTFSFKGAFSIDQNNALLLQVTF